MVCAWGEWRGNARRSGLLWLTVVGHLLATAAYAQVTLTPGDTREIPLPDRKGTVTLSLEVPPGEYVLELTEYLAKTIVEIPERDGLSQLSSISGSASRIYWHVTADTQRKVPVYIRVRNRESTSAHIAVALKDVAILTTAARDATRHEAIANRLAIKLSDDRANAALDTIRLARDAWSRAGRAQEVARCNFLIAKLHRTLGNHRESLSAARLSADQARKLNLLTLTGQAMNSAALASIELLDESAARAFLAEARPLLDTLPVVNSAEYNLCFLEFELENYDKAQECFEKLLPIARKFGDLDRLRRYQNLLAGVHSRANRPLAAIPYLEDAMETARLLNDEANRARTLNNIGVQYRRTSRFQDALDSYYPALELYKALGRTRDEARVLGNIGLVYNALGDYNQAKEFLSRSQDIWSGSPDGYLVRSKISLARALIELGENEKAFALYDDALHLASSVRVRPSTLAGWTAQRAIAEIKARDAQAGVSSLKDFLNSDLGQNLTEISAANAHYMIGTTLAATGESEAAIRHIEVALEKRRSVYDNLGVAQATAALGWAYRRQGKNEYARELAIVSIEQIESLRADIASADLRAVYQDTVSDAYELAVETTMDHSDFESSAALALAESYRAQTLIDILANNRKASEDLPSSLRAEREQLLAKINFIEDKRLRGEPIPDDLPEIINALNVLDKKIGEVDPRFLASDRKQALTPNELQSLLHDGDVVLQYFLGTANSYVWVISPDKIDAYTLTDGRRIRRMAKRVHTSLANRGDYRRDAAALGDLLLSPASTAIEQAKNVIVIADDTLHYTPFEVLSTATSNRPLLSGKTVSYLPSMTTLALTRQSTKTPASDGIAILADPVFDPQDERLASASIAAAMAPDATRSGGPILNRLKMSGQEATTIQRLANNREVWLRTGTGASADALNASAIQEAQIVHIASHGFVDDDVSARTGLALAMVDDAGQPVTGFVGLRQIYNLNLSADLVVLSACDTGLGQNLAGEGLLGLTRGFMYAGAKRVIASLWQVDDRATATLMEYFYEGLLTDGLAPSAALAQAKQRMQREPRWRHPNYWSGFVLLGDWLPLSSG